MTDTWTWADEQAWLEATSREAENFVRRMCGMPEVDPWERANTRANVNEIIEQAFALIENGDSVNLKVNRT